MDGRQRLSDHIEQTLGETQLSASGCDSEVIYLMVEYMKGTLEKPHPVFGNMPICPFARKARLEARILYKVDRFSAHTDLKPDSPVMRIINEFCQDERYEVLLVIHPDKEAMTGLAMQQFIDDLNEKISAAGLVAFGGHPADDFNIQGVYTRQEPYIHFTVQSKQLLNQASAALMKTDYYNNWTPENLRYIGFPRRE
jgi:hypothetical protein